MPQGEVFCIENIVVVVQSFHILLISLLQVNFLGIGECTKEVVVHDESLEATQLSCSLDPGSLIPVQVTQVRITILSKKMQDVTQVNSVMDLYVCTHPVDARERLQEEIDRFYSGGEGRGWLVDNPRPGRLYAAPYEKDGFHRALLRKIVSTSNSTVEVFYVDFGTVAVVNVSKLRLLHINFLQPPAMAIQVRLWGLRGGGNSKLLKELSEGNLREGDLLAR